ncbi:hypothetical protein [Nocardia jiangsuensis]|uniref:Uncharacterized protein n=1 Tax=Nocardia jiangsuensis TaxID=1691563 RepID=A0ABV8DTJ0_9NOCA
MAKDPLDAIDGPKRDPRPDGCKKPWGVEGYRLRVFRVADRKEVYRAHR